MLSSISISTKSPFTSSKIPLSSSSQSQSQSQFQFNQLFFFSFFSNSKQCPPLKSPSRRCSSISVSVAEASREEELKKNPQPTRPSSAEVSRTLTEICSQGTLCSVTPEGWPLGIGVQFAVDNQGMPILKLNSSSQEGQSFGKSERSSLHVQIEEGGSFAIQCTLQGRIFKPEDMATRKRLDLSWKKKFNKEIGDEFMYMMNVEKVLHMENFDEDGIWITGTEYSKALPDPLRTSAKKIVDEMNSKHLEDIHRYCNSFLDLEFQETEVKMVWIDRLGFDLHLLSPEGETMAVRIPFPREVADEKAAKSSLTCLSQLAWEVEKSYAAPEFERIKCLKKLTR